MTDSGRTRRYDRRQPFGPKNIRVVVRGGAQDGASRENSGDDPIGIGTAADNDLVLEDETVSRYHLEVRRTENGIAVTDLGSLNGTFVRDVRVVEAIVEPGDAVQIGSTTLDVVDADVAPSSEVDRDPEIPGMVYASAAMAKVARLVHSLARSKVSVLVQGETGTGKEVVAQAIHALGDRAEGPFEIVDCGSLPATLIASMLFGHERGAFTGADRRVFGAFERANGGTILLDEIGELPLEVQPALLGVLERRTFRPLGSTREVTTDVRVIAATHRELRAAVNEGGFRADLYYRLAVARIVVPPLRQRPEDVEPLVKLFVHESARDGVKNPFGPAAIERLRAQRWSGNVRELRNVVESALAMGETATEAETETAAPGDPSELTPYRLARAGAIARFEREYLERLMDATAGNASEASRRARVDRPHLLRLLRKHGLR